MPRKLLFKDVKQYFEDRNCELYETEYIDCMTKMRYRCKCGNTDCKITFSKFKKGQRCRECSGSKKFTLKEVKQYFEDHNCELFEKEYINTNTPMRYRCDCGNSDCKISFDHFKRGKRCMECSGNKKPTFEEVKQYFKDHNCELMEIEYKNTHTKMRYICKCGNSECKISFSDFKNGTRCRKCSGYEKPTFEFVKQHFEDRGCELYETEYIDCDTLMKYRCICGNDKCKTTFYNFKKGKGCKECISKRISGKNHWSYDPNLTDEEREENRSRPGCKKWRKLILKRDNNTCQCCFEIEVKLIAHHIENYANNKELRTVLSNGFLFCKKHHIEFHKIYGNNCNREQLEEFLNKVLI